MRARPLRTFVSRFLHGTSAYASCLVASCLCLPAVPSAAQAQLPRKPSELLLVGDSVTAGIYFLQLDSESMRQAWSGQLIRRLGMEAPRSPYDGAFPIDHLRLTNDGLGFLGWRYIWEGRRAFLSGKTKYGLEDERMVMAIPGQTLSEFLYQSSDTRDLNRHSSGWTFANILIPQRYTAIETIEAWKKQPRWVVVFLGSNDLLSAFGIVGKATPPPLGQFRKDYEELIGRLRAKMAPDAPATQLILLTLPDVTKLPFVQSPPGVVSNGFDSFYPDSTTASTSLIDYRRVDRERMPGEIDRENIHRTRPADSPVQQAPPQARRYRFQGSEVWTPDELRAVRRKVTEYNMAIRAVAQNVGASVVDITAIMAGLAEDKSFSSPASPYFSPDLHHPSYKTHAIIADAVLDKMASVAGEDVPGTKLNDTPLPSAFDIAREKSRTNAMMHLALQGLETGPLPPKATVRWGFESAGQAGTERVGEVVFSPMLGVEMLPVPVMTTRVMRLGLTGRMTIAALQASDEDTDFFPERSFEVRAGAGFEPIGAWDWNRWEAGALYTAGDGTNFGYYGRKEIRAFYGEISSRGWVPDRFELGIRIGRQPIRPGRNGN